MFYSYIRMKRERERERVREREGGKWRQLQHCTFSIWVRQEHFQTVNEVCAIERVTTNPDTKRLTQTNLCCLVHSFICQRPGSRDNTWKIKGCVYASFLQENEQRKLSSPELKPISAHSMSLESLLSNFDTQNMDPAIQIIAQ